MHVNLHVATCIDAAALTALTKKHILVAPVFFPRCSCFDLETHFVAPVFFLFQWFSDIKCSRIIIKLYTKIKRHIKNNNKNVKAHYAKTTKAVASFTQHKTAGVLKHGNLAILVWYLTRSV